MCLGPFPYSPTVSKTVTFRQECGVRWRRSGIRKKMGMLDRREDSPWAERRATRPPVALVIDRRRGSTGVTS